MKQTLTDMLRQYTIARQASEERENREALRVRQEAMAATEQALRDTIKKAVGIDSYALLNPQYEHTGWPGEVIAVVRWGQLQARIRNHPDVESEREYFHLDNGDTSESRYVEGPKLLEGILDILYSQLTVSERKAMSEDRLIV